MQALGELEDGVNPLPEATHALLPVQHHPVAEDEFPFLWLRAADRNAGVTNPGVTNAGVTNSGVTNPGVTNSGVTIQVSPTQVSPIQVSPPAHPGSPHSVLPQNSPVGQA